MNFSELLKQLNLPAKNASIAVETFGVRVHIEWDPQAAVTSLGQLPFFITFLNMGNLFDPWVEGCLLQLKQFAWKNRQSTQFIESHRGITRY